jgi:D-alanyl-D-alanine carboxypeptidase
MVHSICEMLGVHALVSAAAEGSCPVLRQQARADLSRLGLVAQSRGLSWDEKHASDVAVEVLVALAERDNPAKQHCASRYRETLKQFYLPTSPTRPFYHA